MFVETDLATTYFRGQLPDNYRPRYPVSLPSSEWDRVVPGRTSHQITFNERLIFLYFGKFKRI